MNGCRKCGVYPEVSSENQLWEGREDGVHIRHLILKTAPHPSFYPYHLSMQQRVGSGAFTGKTDVKSSYIPDMTQKPSIISELTEATNRRQF